MANNAKVVIAGAAVILVSAALAATGMVAPAAGVLVAGVAGVVVLHRRWTGPADEDGGGGRGQSKLDRAIEDRGPAAPTPPAPALPTRPADGGLPTWSPAPRDTAPARPAPAEPATPLRPRAVPAPAPAAEDANPLADLDRLDEIDPIAEVERIEGRSASGKVASSPAGTFSFSSAPRPVNEATVRTDDDIMAASEATELHVGAGEDSELARLLAKVQQRLAAYE